MGENITSNLSDFSCFIARNAAFVFWEYLPAVNINISLDLRNNDWKPRARGKSIVNMFNNTCIIIIIIIIIITLILFK